MLLHALCSSARSASDVGSRSLEFSEILEFWNDLTSVGSTGRPMFRHQLVRCSATIRVACHVKSLDGHSPGSKMSFPKTDQRKTLTTSQFYTLLLRRVPFHICRRKAGRAAAVGWHWDACASTKVLVLCSAPQHPRQFPWHFLAALARNSSCIWSGLVFAGRTQHHVACLW